MPKNKEYCLPCKLNYKVKSVEKPILYKFPSDPPRRKQWANLLELGEAEDKISTNCRVCEHHFERDQKVNKRLKKDALPAGPFRLPKKTYYQGPGLEALRKAAGQKGKQYPTLIPKIAPFQIQTGSIPGLALPPPTVSSSDPTSSKRMMTYVVPALLYIEVDEHGSQRTTVVPQALPHASTSGSGVNQ